MTQTGAALQSCQQAGIDLAALSTTGTALQRLRARGVAGATKVSQGAEGGVGAHTEGVADGGALVLPPSSRGASGGVSLLTAEESYLHSVIEIVAAENPVKLEDDDGVRRDPTPLCTARAIDG